jgi:uracil phosphoribosyltransferase
VSCHQGIQAVHDRFPEVVIYTAAVDRHLDENAYILPGLGDAGDRIFGTK